MVHYGAGRSLGFTLQVQHLQIVESVQPPGQATLERVGCGAQGSQLGQILWWWKEAMALSWVRFRGGGKGSVGPSSSVVEGRGWDSEPAKLEENAWAHGMGIRGG